MTAAIVVTGLRSEALGTAAALAVAAEGGGERDGGPRAAPVLAYASERALAPTLLATPAARELERCLGEDGLEAAARGRYCALRLEPGDAEEVERVLGEVEGRLPLIVSVSPRMLESLLTPERCLVARADLAREADLCALLVAAVRDRCGPVRIDKLGPGWIGARRSLAGLEPGGATTTRYRRLLDALQRQAGQAMPLAVLILAATAVAIATVLAVGSAVVAKGRAQTVADLSALAGARVLHEQGWRTTVAPRLADSAPNLSYLTVGGLRQLARAEARRVARHNDLPVRALTVRFRAFRDWAPSRVRVVIEERLREGPRIRTAAVAEAVPEPAGSAAGAAAIGVGGYTGPLVVRQGQRMRPDVGRAFDRLAAAAGAAGHLLAITSAYRSDAEQAVLFDRNPDPKWVAPPGVSLHRCGTELDLGPASAHGWLLANAPRFGFVRRYSWEAWHFGFTGRPAPCSAGPGNESHGRRRAGRGDRGRAIHPDAGGLPAWVPVQYRASILETAARNRVSAQLLASQLQAESNFNPGAVSPAGALGIAQFIPSTARSVGLADPFDPKQAIAAQGRLMAQLLARFDGDVTLALAAYNAGEGAVAACGCVPPYPETRAYVARISAMLGPAAGAWAPAATVRLVS